MSSTERPSSPTTEDYVGAGLYDPDLHEGTGRLELLQWLAELGFDLDEMIDADRRQALAAAPGDRRLVAGPLATRDEAIKMSGLDPDLFDALSTAFGLAPIAGAPPGEVGYTLSEIEALRAFGALPAMFSTAEAIGLVRVLGSSMNRIAEAGVSLFLVDIESPHLLAGASELELAHKVHDAVGLIDGVSVHLDPILRRQVLQAIERTRRTTIGESERFQYRYAIGFVDLIGFTALSGKLPAPELAAFLRDFEGRAHDVANEAGARVVKLIGDEVMFVATDARDACRAALALMEAFDDEAVVPRGGAAYGDVLLRGGDYFGSVVNLAARLVEHAVPREMLVTEELATAASRCTFEPAGRRMVRGFDEPVAVRTLVSA